MSSINSNQNRPSSFAAGNNFNSARFASDPAYAAKVMADMMAQSDSLASSSSQDNSARSDASNGSGGNAAPVPAAPQPPAANAVARPAPIARKPIAGEPVVRKPVPGTSHDQPKPAPALKAVDSAPAPSVVEAPEVIPAPAPKPVASAPAPKAVEPTPVAPQAARTVQGPSWESRGQTYQAQPMQFVFTGPAPLPKFDAMQLPNIAGSNPNRKRTVINAWDEHLQIYNSVAPKLPQDRPIGGGIALPRYGYEEPNLDNPDNRNWLTESELRMFPYMDLPRCNPWEFAHPARTPEIKYTDKLGMQFPGVVDTKQCEQGFEHEVARWNFANWPEYDTKLASHGITYEDFYRMLSGSIEILQRAPKEQDNFFIAQMVGWNLVLPGIALFACSHREGPLSEAFIKNHRGTWHDLKKFYYDVTDALRHRGLPVVVKLKNNSTGPGQTYWSNYDISVRHHPLHQPVRHVNAFQYAITQ